MTMWTRLGMALALLCMTVAWPPQAGAAEKLRFAVGPFQPAPGDTRKAYEPFFKYIAGKLGLIMTSSSPMTGPASPSRWQMARLMSPGWAPGARPHLGPCFVNRILQGQAIMPVPERRRSRLGAAAICLAEGNAPTEPFYAANLVS